LNTCRIYGNRYNVGVSCEKRHDFFPWRHLEGLSLWWGNLFTIGLKHINLHALLHTNFSYPKLLDQIMFFYAMSLQWDEMNIPLYYWCKVVIFASLYAYEVDNLFKIFIFQIAHDNWCFLLKIVILQWPLHATCG
jgi:hypothetical protein